MIRYEYYMESVINFSPVPPAVRGGGGAGTADPLFFTVPRRARPFYPAYY
jgi:hypothetical protein